MWSHNQRHSIGRLWLRRLGLVILVALIFIAATSVWGVFKKERESASLRAQAENELQELRVRESQLGADIESLRTDRGLEEALREQYGLGERGEQLIVIVDPPTPVPLEATSTMSDMFLKLFRWW